MKIYMIYIEWKTTQFWIPIPTGLEIGGFKIGFIKKSDK